MTLFHLKLIKGKFSRVIVASVLLMGVPQMALSQGAVGRTQTAYEPSSRQCTSLQKWNKTHSEAYLAQIAEFSNQTRAKIAQMTISEDVYQEILQSIHSLAIATQDTIDCESDDQGHRLLAESLGMLGDVAIDLHRRYLSLLLSTMALAHRGETSIQVSGNLHKTGATQSNRPSADLEDSNNNGQSEEKSRSAM